MLELPQVWVSSYSGFRLCAMQDRCRDTAVGKFSLTTKVTDAVSLHGVICAIVRSTILNAIATFPNLPQATDQDFVSHWLIYLRSWAIAFCWAINNSLSSRICSVLGGLWTKSSTKSSNGEVRSRDSASSVASTSWRRFICLSRLFDCLILSRVSWFILFLAFSLVLL